MRLTAFLLAGISLVQNNLQLLGIGAAGPAASNFSPVPISNFQTGVDNAYETNSTTGIAAPTLTIFAPYAFGGGHNCAVLVVHGSSTYTFTTPSGWTAGPTVTGNNVKLALFYQLGDTSGTQSVAISMTGTGSAVGNALGGWLTEFENCNTSSVGGNGTLDTAATGSAITLTLSAAPTLGDAAIAYFWDTASQNNPPVEDTSLAVGSGFTALSASKSFGKIAEYNTATTSTSVPVTYSGTNTILGVGIVIKQGPAGTAPTTGLYISNHQVEQAAYATNTTWYFPCTGNLVVGMMGTGSKTITSFAGSTGTWQNAVTNTTNAVAQIFYGYGSGFTSALTVTPTFSGTQTPGTEISFACVNNAATSSLLDTTATNNSNQTTAANLTTVSITPAAANEIIFSTASIDVHTLQGAVTDTNGHTPIFFAATDSKGDDAASNCAESTPNSTLDEDNGYAFFITTNTTAVTFIYSGTQTTGSCTTNPTGTGLNGYAAAAFK